ncbi:MAG: hypothetical protein J0L92_40365, partial [Deltaproteobacteria bacterium]|nr:hypothetical protein [Deltaproteobacteria bacterium]
MTASRPASPLAGILRPTALATTVGCATLAASCGGGLHMEPRYVALHNAMTALGMVQSGGLNQGSLSEGQERATPVDLQPGDCVTFVALGESGVGNVDVIVRDASGSELARDRTEDAQAATQFCPSYAGRFDVVIRMTRGGGSYLATSWTGGPRGPSTGPGPDG